MKMDKNETITIQIGGSNGETTDKSPLAASQPNEIVDLTSDFDTSEAASYNLTIIDLVPIAKPMYQFEDSPPNPTLQATLWNLPAPLQRTILKTTVFCFRTVRALPGETKKYTPKAQVYIELLQKFNPAILKDVFALVCLKNSYAAVQEHHIPGSTSFLRFNDADVEPTRLVADAMHQRLLNLRKCNFAKREFGENVKTFFDHRYNRDDPTIQIFVRTWLDELKQQMNATNDSNDTMAPTISATTAALAASASISASASASASISASTMVSAEQRQQRFATQQHAMLHPQQQALVAKAAQVAAMTQQHYPTHHAAIPIVHQPQPTRPYDRFLQQLQHRRQDILRRQQLLDGLQYQEAMMALQQGTQQQQLIRQIAQRQLQQWSEEGQEMVRQRQRLNQYRQEHQLQEQQLRQMQQQLKSKPKLPPNFPKRGRSIPFADLANIYEEYWEETTQSIFTADSDSDEDDCETEQYFRSLHNNGIVPEAPLPPPKTNPDLYIPVSSDQFLQCPQGLPYVKGNVQPTTLVDTNLSQWVTPHDVVMPCEDCPLQLAKALHDLQGNRHFLRLVSEQRDAYAAATTSEKVAIFQRIVQTIHKRKGVFRKAGTTNGKPILWSSTYQEIDAFLRYRLQHGFPDILGHWNVGTQLNLTATQGDNTPKPKWRSLVLDVEHAPMVGLVDGYLEWDTVDKSQNPKLKLSDLKTLPPRQRNCTSPEPSSVSDADETKEQEEIPTEIDAEQSANQRESKESQTAASEETNGTIQERAADASEQDPIPNDDQNVPPTPNSQQRSNGEQSSKRNCPETSEEEIGSQPVTKQPRTEGNPLEHPPPSLAVEEELIF